MTKRLSDYQKRKNAKARKAQEALSVAGAQAQQRSKVAAPPLVLIGGGGGGSGHASPSIALGGNGKSSLTSMHAIAAERDAALAVPPRPIGLAPVTMSIITAYLSALRIAGIITTAQQNRLEEVLYRVN